MATVFSDSFDRSDRNLNGDNGWTVENGSFAIASNVVTTTSLAGLCYNSAAISSADYKVSVTAKCGSEASGGIDVIGRRTATNNFYLAQISMNDTLQLYKQVSGSWTQLGSNVAFTAAANTYYKLTLSMEGTAIKLYVDDAEKISQTDSAISATGYGGLRTGSAESYTFNDFLIEDFGGGEPPATAVKDFIGGGFIPFAR